jgi:hypothetical protein
MSVDSQGSAGLRHSALAKAWKLLMAWIGAERRIRRRIERPLHLERLAFIAAASIVMAITTGLL